MGKHERGQIELMEKSVVNLLNGKKSFIKTNSKWFRHMLAFVDYIKKHYPKFRQVKHIGNQYGELKGDLELITRDKQKVFIELKASESRSGKGTLANISQNALTLYALVDKNTGKRPLGWSEFRKKSNFKKKVTDWLNKYSSSKKLSFYEKARLVRAKAEQGNKKALTVKRAIMKLAKKDKKDYLDYIKQFPINNKNLKRFVFCMLNGIHTQKEISDFLNRKEKIISETKDSISIITLYANLQSGRVIVNQEEDIDKRVLSRTTKLTFNFPEKLADKVYAYIVFDTKKSEKILGLVYHWKNIFQGIQTPCINVFLV